jgi:ATP-binding cassette subfamily C protein
MFLAKMLYDTVYASSFKNTLVDIRSELFGSMLKNNLSSFNKNLGSSYINNLTNDMNILYSDYFMNFKMLLLYIISFIVSFAAIIRTNVFYGLIILAISFLPIVISKIFIGMLSTNKKAFSESSKKMISKSKDMLDGFLVIKQYNIEKRMIDKFNVDNEKLESSRLRASMLEFLVENINDVIAIGIFFIALLVGAYLVSIKSITIGKMMMITQLSNNVLIPIQRIPTLYSKIRSVDMIVTEIEEIKDINKLEKTDFITKTSLDKEISIKDLSFSYKGSDSIFNELSLNMEKGKKYALIGKSGSGKSTFTKLISGLIDEYEGEIIFDDVNLKNINRTDISKLISIVDQNSYLFNDSIKNNICLYERFSDEEIKEAIKNSGLEKMVNKLEDGIDTRIVENASNISGGQKQRICIARALIRKSPILIFDESTSALDTQLRKEIEEILFSIEDRIIIVVTHQVEDLDTRFDYILRLSNKKLVKNTSELSNCEV